MGAHTNFASPNFIFGGLSVAGDRISSGPTSNSVSDPKLHDGNVFESAEGLPMRKSSNTFLSFTNVFQNTADPEQLAQKSKDALMMCSLAELKSSCKSKGLVSSGKF